MSLTILAKCFAAGLLVADVVQAQVQFWPNPRADHNRLETTRLDFDGDRFVAQYRSGDFYLMYVENRFELSDLVGITPGDFGAPLRAASRDLETITYSREDRAFRWQEVGGSSALPSNNPNEGTFWDTTFVTSVSGNGQFVWGGGLSNAVGDFVIISWSGSAPPVSICNTSLEGCIRMTALSLDGSRGVAVDDGAPNPTNHIYLWDQTAGLTILSTGMGSGHPFGFGAMNDQGNILVVTDFDGTVLRWTEGQGVVNLGMPPGATVASGLQINGAGDVVLEGTTGSLWTQSAGWKTPQEYLVPRGATGLMTGQFSLTDFRGLSGDGNAYIANLHQGAQHVEVVVQMGDPAPGSIGQNYCNPSAFNSSGFPGTLVALGSTGVADNDLTLVAQTLPPTMCGYVLNSLGQDVVIHPGGSLGTLCLGGGAPIGRHNAISEIGIADSDGAFSIPIDLTQLPTPMMPVPVGIGETRHFQVWYRDVDFAGMPTSNFTDAVAITFE